MKFTPILLFLLLQAMILPAGLVDVDDYGAVAGDGLDDTPAIQTAVAALTDGDTLWFSAGTYDISGPLPNVDFDENVSNRIMNFVNLDDLTILGNNTRLLGKQWGTVMSFFRCDNLVIKGITIDWRKNESPHSAGKVKVKGSDYIDVEIEFPNIVRADLPADVISEFYPYGGAPGRPAYGGYFIPNSDPRETQKLSSTRMRVFVDVSRIGDIDLNDRVVILHKKHGMNITQYYSCDGITIHDVNIYGGGGLGVYAVGCSDIDIDDLHIKPDDVDGAFVSSTAASTRFFSCRGSYSVKNSDYRNTGDDGINLHTEYFKITSISNPKTFKMAKPDGGVPNINRMPRVGDVLEVGMKPQSSLAAVGTVTITSVAVNGNFLDVSTQEDLPTQVQVNDFAIDVSAIPDTVTIHNLKCVANRGRGIIFRARKASIKNCSFSFISGPGVLLGPQVDYFYEGPGVSNVSVDNCVFSRCNLGHASEEAMLSLAAHLTAGYGESPGGVVSNVSITNCKFWGGGIVYPGRNGIQLASTDDINLSNNEFDSNIDERIIVDNNSSTRDILVNKDYMPASSSFVSPLTQIPGTIQAEDFDNGGESFAYFDLTSNNIGNSYRLNDEVDVFPFSYPNHNVRHLQKNEWLSWTVNVPAAGNYSFTFHIGGKAGVIRFALEDKNVNQLAYVDENPGSTASFTVTSPCVALSAGVQKLRMWIDVGGFEIDKIVVNSCPGMVIAPMKTAPNAGIQVSPNPVKDRLYLHLPAGVNPPGALSTLQGKKLMQWPKVPATVDVKDLAPGIYLLQIGEGFRQKIVKY